MSLILDHLRQLIETQIKDHKLVTWFDPEKHYAALWPALCESLPPDVATAQYQDSFFALRQQIEPLLSAGETPPRLLVYVPLDAAQTGDALCELQQCGVVLQPGRQPASRNTRLSIVARNALVETGQWTREDALKVEREIDAGQYASLAEIETAVRRRAEATGVLQLIFGTGNAREIALQFLSGNAPDNAANAPQSTAEASQSTADTLLSEKNALGELMALLQEQFGAPPEGFASANTLLPQGFRARLARHLLCCDLIRNWRGELPSALHGYHELQDAPSTREAAALVNYWRQRADLRLSYESHAGRVEGELKLHWGDLRWEEARDAHTFWGLERALQDAVARVLQTHNGDAAPLETLCQQRQGDFWSQQKPQEGGACWALLRSFAHLLSEASRVAGEMPDAPQDSAVIFACYTRGQNAWCELDGAHRHMERFYHRVECPDEWQNLAARCRARYTQVAGDMAALWLRAWKNNEFQVPGAPLQCEIWEKAVRPALKEKVAYVLVDALRFEMARELKEALADDFAGDLQAAVGIVPSITKIGMAALLPNASRLELTTDGKGHLWPRIEGTLLKDRASRLKYLQLHSGLPADSTVETTLDKMLPQPRKALRDALKKARLIVLTSQEIDALCEGDNVPMARRTMDDMIGELRRAFRVLRDCGVSRLIVVADHGYLFGEELDDAMKIDAPGGDTLELHRRVWIGRGGHSDDAWMRAPLSQLARVDEDDAKCGDLEIGAPWGVGGFKKAGGASAYFHGGLSPQEMAIPILTLRSGITAPAREDKITWTFTANRAQLTTPFLSLQISGVSTGHLDLAPPKIRIAVHAAAELFAQPVSATYGLDEASGDVQLQWQEDAPAIEEQASRNRILQACDLTLMFEREELERHNNRVLRVSLQDAASGATLAHIDDLRVSLMV